MRYWLMKSEPDTFGIDDLACAPDRPPAGRACATSRHATCCATRWRWVTWPSSTTPPVPSPASQASSKWSRAGYPDASAWNRRSPYYDPKSPENKPLWYTVDVRLMQKRARSCCRLRCCASMPPSKLDGLLLLRRGNRLSITPVEARTGSSSARSHDHRSIAMTIETVIGCSNATSLTRLLVFLQRVYILGPRTNL